MDIRAAAHALGGDVVNRNTVLCPGPAHGKADRSLSISFDAAAPDGFLVHSFAGDDWQQCRDMVRLALGIGAFEPKGGAGRPAMTFVAAVVPSPAAVQKRAYAVSLWQETRPIRGTVAERYLGNRHVLVDEALTGKALRFHPACPFRLDSGETIC
ncbi:MAG: virulence-associated protein E, partial [Mesorhizobium sp.]